MSVIYEKPSEEKSKSTSIIIETNLTIPVQLANQVEDKGRTIRVTDSIRRRTSDQLKSATISFLKPGNSVRISSRRTGTVPLLPSESDMDFTKGSSRGYRKLKSLQIKEQNQISFEGPRETQQKTDMRSNLKKGTSFSDYETNFFSRLYINANNIGKAEAPNDKTIELPSLENSRRRLGSEFEEDTNKPSKSLFMKTKNSIKKSAKQEESSEKEDISNSNVSFPEIINVKRIAMRLNSRNKDRDYLSFKYRNKSSSKSRISERFEGKPSKFLLDFSKQEHQQKTPTLTFEEIQGNSNFKFLRLINNGTLASWDIDSLFSIFLDENNLNIQAATVKQKMSWYQAFYRIVKYIAQQLFADHKMLDSTLLTFTVSRMLSFPMDIGSPSNSESQLLKIIKALRLECDQSIQMIEKQSDVIVDLHEKLNLFVQKLTEAQFMSLRNPSLLGEHVLKLLDVVEGWQKTSLKFYGEIEGFKNIRERLKESLDIKLKNIAVRKSILRGLTPKSKDESYKFYEFQADTHKKVYRKFKSHSLARIEKIAHSFEENMHLTTGSTGRPVFAALVKKKDQSTQFSNSVTQQSCQTDISLATSWFDNFLLNQEDAVETNKTVKLCKKIEKYARREEVTQSRGKLEALLLKIEDAENLPQENVEKMQREILTLLANYSKEIISNRIFEKENEQVKAQIAVVEAKNRVLNRAVRMLDQKLADLTESLNILKAAHVNCKLYQTTKSLGKNLNPQQQFEGFDAYIKILGAAANSADLIKPTAIESKTRAAYRLVFGYFSERISNLKKKRVVFAKHQEPPFVQSFYYYLAKIVSSGGFFSQSKLKENIVALLRCQLSPKVQIILRFLNITGSAPLPDCLQSKYMQWLSSLEELKEGIDLPVDFEACRHYFPLERFRKLLRDSISLEVDSASLEMLSTEVELLAVEDQSKRNKGRIVDFDDFFLTVSKFHEKKANLSFFHFANIFETIDITRSGSVSLQQIVSFFRLFYRHKKEVCNRVTLGKLRFLFYFYLDRSLLKLSLLSNEDFSYLSVFSAKEEEPLDPNNNDNGSGSQPSPCLYENHRLGKSEFFYLCVDLKIFTVEEYFSEFISISKDRFEDEYNFRKRDLTKQKEDIKRQVSNLKNISAECISSFLDNLEAFDQSDAKIARFSSKTYILYITQHRIIMDQYHSLLELDRSEVGQLHSLNHSKFLLDSIEREIISDLKYSSIRSIETST